MWFYHLWLLIQKSLRYAWRQRTCRCCPKIICELFIPAICLLFLLLVRWIHTPPVTKPQPSLNNYDKPTNIPILPSSIISPQYSIPVFDYPSIPQCPSSYMTIKIADRKLLSRLKSVCPQSRFNLSQFAQSNEFFVSNKTSIGYNIYYRCGYDTSDWCQNASLFNDQNNLIQTQHPSVSTCSRASIYNLNAFLQGYFALESYLHTSRKKQQLSIYTWPCSSYISDSLFEFGSSFTLGVILFLIDGCILFGFTSLFLTLIEEKHQGITELLRLISIRPILNSLAGFLRFFLIQLLTNIFLIFILKASFDGGIYLPYVSFWLIIPTILFWTIQVFSQSVLIAHIFSSGLIATLWSLISFIISWLFIYLPFLQLPIILHLIVSGCLPFYSIKRLFILLFRINTDLGRTNYFITEIILIWFSILIGSFLMWLLACYFERTRPGKYGIPQSWTWPIDSFRYNRIAKQKRRESVDMQMVETLPDVNTTVRVNNLTKTYGRPNSDTGLAVDHVSFKLQRSTIHGLIGHNGAGKTSTMEMMCGLISCDCGSIEIHNKDLNENLEELRTCIGYCPQQDMLFSHLTVQEQLEFYTRVRSKKNHLDQNRIQELLTMMEMNEYRQRLCHTLSGGMKRKLSILCAFAGDASVIILDEPSSSLDLAARRALCTWLRAHKENRTILVSSHLLDEVEELCDSVIILDSGKIRAQDTVLELKRQFGPAGDRFHLENIPPYIPKQWIIDEKTHFIEVPDRKQLVHILERLERDNIKYSLENITLDDIFIQLTSESLPAEQSTVQSQIDTLFAARTCTQRNQLWSQQILGVLIRRCQVFLRRARLLPIALILYLAYALAPLYMPSFTRSSTEYTRYIISAPSEIINKVSFKKFDAQFTPSFDSSQKFQVYLLGIRTWQSDYHSYKKIVGIRISSFNHVECYVPTPYASNVIRSCLPIFTLFSNQTLAPLRFINEQQFNLLETPSLNLLKHDAMFYCFYTLPITLHLSIGLLLLILIIPAALTIQDYASGIHSYSLIHGLRSPIHWMITFLSDLILCLLWLGILILIARFVHSSVFNGRFFALTPLFFIIDLPFIYLIAKFFTSPILGAATIVFLLICAHISSIIITLIGLFRGYRVIATIVPILRWLLLLIFPNVNIYTLIVAILRPYSCPYPDGELNQGEEFSHERYRHKILIHILITIAQFIIFFIVLILIDTWKLPILSRRQQGKINQQQEDADVTAERQRIELMIDEDKQREALIVDNLSKRYHSSKAPAVNRLTFAVPHRQCFGLLGFNGSGKTTTFRMLVGELRPSSGSLYQSNQESIGYCPQEDIAFSALTVGQSIDYICRLHGLNPSLLNNLILSQFQLENYRHRLVSHLSGGTRRRLHLALCLIGSPTLLLLDEPTAKVDPLLRNHIRLILQHRPINTSIIFASHSMLECEQLCDRLTILVCGNAKCLGSPRHLKDKYSTDYRIRLTLLESSADIPSLQRVANSNEYTYPRSNLSGLFKILENLVEQNIIETNYKIQLTSLEHIFLSLHHSIDPII